MFLLYDELSNKNFQMLLLYDKLSNKNFQILSNKKLLESKNYNYEIMTMNNPSPNPPNVKNVWNLLFVRCILNSAMLVPGSTMDVLNAHVRLTVSLEDVYSQPLSSEEHGWKVSPPTQEV